MKEILSRVTGMFAALILTLVLFTGCNGTPVVPESSDVSSTGTESSDVSSTGTESSDVSSTGTGTSDVSNSSGTNPSGSNEQSDASSPVEPMTALTRDQVMQNMPSNLKGTTITYFTWYDARTAMEGSAIENFEKLTGCTVKNNVGSYENFASELTALVASGRAPDLVRCKENGINNVKALQPLDDLNFSFNDTAWDHQTMADYTFNGKAYATNLLDTAFYDSTVCFYNYNLLVKQCGLEDPYSLWKNGKWTWDAFWDMCEEFVKECDGAYGVCFEPLNLLPLCSGMSMIAYDGTKYVSNMNNELLVSTWYTTLDKINKGLLTKDTWQMNAFVNGDSLFFCSSITGGFSTSEYFAKLKAKSYLRAVPLPSGAAGGKDYQMLGEYSAWGIPKGASNPEAVPYLLRYMLDMGSYDTSKMFSNDTAVNSQFLEVLKAARSNPNRITNTTKNMLTLEDNGVREMDIRYQLYTHEANQITTILQTYAPNVQDAVDKGNKQILLMK